MNKCILFTIVCGMSIMTACQDGSHKGGDTAGNGGDDVAMDFIAASRKAEEYLALNPEVGGRVNLDQLRSKIASMSVSSTDEKLMLKNEEKTAINYPSLNRVQINRSRWNSSPRESRPALALHECLGLIGVDDKNYILSSELLEADPETLKPLRGLSDIVIIVDDSGSMGHHQANLARNVEYLWAKIRQRRLNFKIAVMTSTAANSGRFVGAVKVITPHTPNGLTVLRDNIRVGTSGDGWEQFFGPIHDGLNLPENQGFLRPSANLELVFLTDAEDGSANWEPETFAKYLWNLKGDPRKVFAYGIVPLLPTGVCQLDSKPQLRLTRFVSLVQGDLHDLCNLSADAPAAIGEKIVNHIKTEGI